MRIKMKAMIFTLAALLCMTVFSIPASANVPSSEEKSVNDSVESKTPLTPKGNLTTIDDVHQVTDTSNRDTVEDKEFVTVQSKNGNTFYIIIDRSGTTENVYFLNAVDENDLIALLEDDEKTQVQSQIHATCTCTTKCELGSVNADCAVCSKNVDECVCTVATTPEPKTEEPEKKQSTTSPLIGLVLLALLGGGGAFYWFNIRNKKSSTKGTTDPNDLYDDEYDEDYEIEGEEADIETEADNETDIENDEESEDFEG